MIGAGQVHLMAGSQVWHLKVEVFCNSLEDDILSRHATRRCVKGFTFGQELVEEVDELHEVACKVECGERVENHREHKQRSERFRDKNH